jgi:hypothetical protein
VTRKKRVPCTQKDSLFFFLTVVASIFVSLVLLILPCDDGTTNSTKKK